jgi:hypothetical protein
LSFFSATALPFLVVHLLQRQANLSNAARFHSDFCKQNETDRGRLLRLRSPQTKKGAERYTYGPDYALQVVTDENGLASTAAALGYDPDLASATWNTQPATPVLPPATNPYDDFPAATGDYAVLGPAIYFRGVATDWTQVFSSQPQVIADIGSRRRGSTRSRWSMRGPIS